jgi:hypothetical protein
MNISIYNVSTPSGGFPTNSVLDPPHSPVSGGLVYASIYLTQGMLLTDGSLTMFNGLNGSLYLNFYNNVTDIYTQQPIVDSVEFTNHPTPNNTRTTFAFDNSLIWNHQSGVYIVSWQQTPIASNYLSIEITEMNGSTNWSWCGFLNAVYPPIIIEHTAYSNSIYIKWNMNVGLFFVEYAPNMIASIISNDNYTITGLTRNTTYSIRVGILYVPYINNVWSGYVNVTTLPTVPDAPTGLTAISYQNLAVKLIITWCSIAQTKFYGQLFHIHHQMQQQ